MNSRKEPEVITIYKTTPYSGRISTKEKGIKDQEFSLSERQEANILSDSEHNIESVQQSFATEEEELLLDTFMEEFLSSMTEEGEGVDTPVSPFGFGEYPDIPADYPWDPIWTLDDESRAHYSQVHPNGERFLELMGRVGIKMWNNGYRFKGISYSEATGKFYFNFPDTVYIKSEEINGVTSVEVIGSPISEKDIDIIRNGGTPPGITVLDMSEGVEPMSFLDL